MFFTSLLPDSAYGRVVLKDSSVIQGTILEETDSIIKVENAYLGTVVIPKNFLLNRYIGSSGSTAASQSAATDIQRGERVPGRSNEPNTNLVFVPTARTCKKGLIDFKDFELLFLTLSAAPTNSTILSAGSLFPITTDFQLYSFAVKQQLYVADDGVFAAALMGQISKPVGMEDVHYFWNTFAICSFQPSPIFSLHGSLLFSGGKRTEWDYSAHVYNDNFPTGQKKNVVYTSINYMAGVELVAATHIKMVVEFFDNLGILDAFGENSGDVYFLNCAVRLFWESISVDIAGLRPISPGADFGSLLLIPFVNVSFRFGGAGHR